MKIRSKLCLGFGGIIILMGIVSFFAIRTCLSALENSIGENSVIIAKEAINKIDRNINYEIESIQNFIANNTVLLTTITESNEKFSNLDDPDQYIKKEDDKWIAAHNVSELSVYNELVKNSLSIELKKMMQYYKKTYGYKVYGEIFVTNRYGANIAQTGVTSDYYQADEEWWQKTKKDGLYLSGLEYDESVGNYCLAFCCRINDGNNEFAGVVKAVLNIQGIYNIINEVRIASKYKTMFLELVSADGKIIYTTADTGTSHNMSDFLNRFDSSECNDYQIIQNDKGQYLVALAISTGYKNFEGLGWKLIIGYNTDEIFRPLYSIGNTILLLSVGIVIIAFIIGMLISLSITHSINRFKVEVVEISKGTLKKKINIISKDEVGDLVEPFNFMLEALREQALNTAEGAEQLAASINEISTTSTQLASSTVETSSSIAEITTTIEQIKQITQNTYTKSVDVMNKSHDVTNIALNGYSATEQAIKGITKIREEMSYIADSAGKLEKQAQNIGDIVNTVNSFSDQINLLSVNASIEAAKAGEYGKGFKIVAREIKTLAKQSKEATEQISRILTEIQKAVGNAMFAVERGSESVKKGVELSEQASISIKTLNESTQESFNASDTISAASLQQLEGMKMLVNTMENIKQSIEQNADGTVQLEQSAISLSALGNKLRDISKRFTIEDL